jgi:hypothetical protein
MSDSGHGDATLDVLALAEAMIKEDRDGADAILNGALTSPHHARHFVNILCLSWCNEMVSHHGEAETLEMLASSRGDVLGHGVPTPADDQDEDGADDDHEPTVIITELQSRMLETGERQADELARLNRAVDRLADILDRKLR